MSLDLTDDKSTLVQVMAWCRQATSHYLSQCWPRSLWPYGVTKPQWVNWQHHNVWWLSVVLISCYHATLYMVPNIILYHELAYVVSASGTAKPKDFQHIEAETRWPTFRRRDFQIHLLEWKCTNFDYISLKFVPKGQINNIPTLVQIMAWRRPGDKPLPELMMVSLMTDICITRPQWVNI